MGTGGYMNKYYRADVHELVNIINSDVDKKDVTIWERARIQDSVLSQKVSIGNESIIVKSILGEKCEIGRRNIISNTILGKGTSTQGNTTIRFSSVGKYCAIAWNVSIGAPNHNISRLAMSELNYIMDDFKKEHMSSFDELSCEVGNDVWIAAGAHVLRGVSISDGAVVAANAVVTKNVPPYAIVAGVPAQIVRYRFDERKIEELIKIAWWDFSEKQFEIAKSLFEDNLTDEMVERLKDIKYNVV